MKADIGEKGKTFHLEVEAEKAKALNGKKLGEELDGSAIDAKLAGFTLKITGLSNSAGFPARSDVEGLGLRRVLLKGGVGMSGKRAKNSKKIRGLRLRKTIRGNTIAKDIAQINLKVVKGSKSLAEILGKPEGKSTEEAKEGKS
ncbi:MAG TPA: 30S ribosomal protein S6e [Nanoarchaeota archaeon]|nr:30S ribosomal protein S6e [Candidatus Pacearchaeota archaeon]HIH17742.1 30S ribosomal protein S6e [Nanoarchaeota archaeon]HIH33806.1 30S ribosomal protein S6e [Nanoarchaeota archaeon]HIH51615.1 30S ribosomal protein S6e [Nanoarchaeota archaeon]HIH65680.1 30S ribosomal protein S6e [Nanoarchaeota archaeon]